MRRIFAITETTKQTRREQMSKLLKTSKIRGRRSLAAICAVLAALPSSATVYTWTGGDAENPTLFSKTANWA